MTGRSTMFSSSQRYDRDRRLLTIELLNGLLSGLRVLETDEAEALVLASVVAHDLRKSDYEHYISFFFKKIFEGFFGF